MPSWSPGLGHVGRVGGSGDRKLCGQVVHPVAIPHIQKGPHADQTTSSLKKLEAGSPDYPGLILGSFPQFC